MGPHILPLRGKVNITNRQRVLQKRHEHGMQLDDILWDVCNKLLWLWLLQWLLWEVEWADSQAGVSLLVLDGLFVTLSPLLLHDEFHLPLCMFNDGSGDFYHIGREVRCASEGVFA